MPVSVIRLSYAERANLSTVSHLWCPPSRTCLKHPTWKCSGTTSAGSLRRGGVEDLVRERSFPLWSSSSSQSGRNVAQPVTQQLPFHAQLSLHHSKWCRCSARVVQLVLLCAEWKHSIRRITPVFVIKHYFSFVNFGQQLRWICALAVERPSSAVQDKLLANGRPVSNTCLNVSSKEQVPSHKDKHCDWKCSKNILSSDTETTTRFCAYKKDLLMAWFSGWWGFQCPSGVCCLFGLLFGCVSPTSSCLLVV